MPLPRSLCVAVMLTSLLPHAVGAQETALPPELAVVPPDAYAFVYLRPAELWQGEPGAALRKLFPREAGEFLKSLAGEDPAETESLVILFATPNSLGELAPEFRDGSGQPLESLVMIETTVKPVEPGKLVERVLGKNAIAKKHHGKTYFESHPKAHPAKHGTMHVLSDRSYVFTMSPAMMKKILEGRAEGPGPLTAALNLAGQKRHVVVGVNATRPPMGKLRQQLLDEWQNGQRFSPDGLAPLATFIPLLDVRSAALALSLGKEIRLEGQASFPTERHAANAAGHLQDALVLIRLFVLGAVQAQVQREMQMMIDDNEEQTGPLVYADLVLISSKRSILLAKRDIRPIVVAQMFLKQAESGLRRATVEQRQKTLILQAQTKFDLDALDVRARDEARSLVKEQESSRYVRRSGNNLAKLMVAMHSYHDVHKHFPASAICDAAGKPLLSWRVAILPYVEELALYQEFKLDQPWDSPHNIKLLAKMPAIYAPPGVKTKEPFTTHYQVFTGPAAVFDLQANRRFSQITDGISNTIGMVEAHDPVAWTKPADLVYDAKKPLPKLGIYPDGFHAAVMDGSVEFLPQEAPEATIRALITFAGGEVVDFPGQRNGEPSGTIRVFPGGKK